MLRSFMRAALDGVTIVYAAWVGAQHPFWGAGLFLLWAVIQIIDRSRKYEPRRQR